jgi:hypothetical protein
MVVRRMFMRYVMRRWMLWHTGHGAYFRPRAQGYTSDVRQAGWYSEKETAAWESHNPMIVRRG